MNSIMKVMLVNTVKRYAAELVGKGPLDQAAIVADGKIAVESATNIDLLVMLCT